MMETIALNNNIKAFYITASSFPDGIAESHQKLHALVPFAPNRRFFGISRPENCGAVVYRAAAEEMHDGEAEELKCGTLIIQKGNYTASTIHDFTKDVTSIERIFKELLSHPGLDPNGYCVEWYLLEKDVRCMVRLKD